MLANVTILGLAAAICYLTAALLLAINIRDVVAAARPGRAESICIILAAVLHGMLLHHLVLVPSGFDFAFFKSLTLAAWIIVLILIFASARLPVIILGIPLFPLTGLTALLPFIFNSESSHIVTQPSTPIILHIMLSMVAYGLLSLGSLQGIVLYIQDWRLRHHKQTQLSALLPPLQKMEHILFFLLTVGFIFLTAALISGMLFVEKSTSHKIILSLVAWLVFGILLAGRKFFGWRGRVAIRLTMLGITSLVLAFFGSKLVLELILGR